MEYDGRWRVTHYSVQRMYGKAMARVLFDMHCMSNPLRGARYVEFFCLKAANLDSEEHSWYAAPLLLSSYKDNKDKVRTHLTSDKTVAVKGALAIHLHAWGAADSRPIHTWHQTVEVRCNLIAPPTYLLGTQSASDVMMTHR